MGPVTQFAQLPSVGIDYFSTLQIPLRAGSTEALFRSRMALDIAHNSMKLGKLNVVARDGIEPPTPAFSGLRSTD